MESILKQEYTDQENTWAAQMAYCNISEDVINHTIDDWYYSHNYTYPTIIQ